MMRTWIRSSWNKGLILRPWLDGVLEQRDAVSRISLWCLRWGNYRQERANWCSLQVKRRCWVGKYFRYLLYWLLFIQKFGKGAVPITSSMTQPRTPLLGNTVRYVGPYTWKVVPVLCYSWRPPTSIWKIILLAYFLESPFHDALVQSMMQDGGALVVASECWHFPDKRWETQSKWHGW